MLSEGAGNDEIASRLGIGTYEVSKRKKEAEQEGLLEPAIPTLTSSWNSGMYREAAEAVGPPQLMDHLSEAASRGLLVAPASVRVYSTPDVGAADWPARLDQLGHRCAAWIRSLIWRAQIVGVSWGGTLEGVVTGIERLPRRARRGQPIWMIPVCGEPLGRLPDRSSASALAQRLDQAINGDRRHSLSLSAVPFLIPIDFHGAADPHSADEVAVVKKLIARVPAHAMIFGGSSPDRRRSKTPTAGPPMADRVSMVLTSVGPQEHPFGYGGEEFLRSAGFKAAQLPQLALSDVSGLLLEREDLSPGQRKLAARIECHWTGISMERLKLCAQRARKQRKAPGVVAVAAGASKATVVIECMRRGLLNHLVIDDDCEHEMRVRLQSLLRSAR
jgi:DNA-binding transcriptional regulator LsrR (DeoR family)